MQLLLKYSLILFSLLLFCACATNMPKQFANLKVGMEKDEILALMDSPQRTQRWKGQDRWTYIIYDDQNNRTEKEVHFENGKAVYLGDPQVPVVSAVQKDQINQDANAELEALYKKQRIEQQKAFPAYEESVKGSDQIRYVPQFEPIQ